MVFRVPLRWLPVLLLLLTGCAPSARGDPGTPPPDPSPPPGLSLTVEPTTVQAGQTITLRFHGAKDPDYVTGVPDYVTGIAARLERWTGDSWEPAWSLSTTPPGDRLAAPPLPWEEGRAFPSIGYDPAGPLVTATPAADPGVYRVRKRLVTPARAPDFKPESLTLYARLTITRS